MSTKKNIASSSKKSQPINPDQGKSIKANKKALEPENLSPKAKALVEELSKELHMSQEHIMELAVMMYRAYKDKV